MSNIKIIDFLDEKGLYAERSYNMGEVKIFRKCDDSVACVLKGSELSENRNTEKVINLIKEKLGEKQG